MKTELETDIIIMMILLLLYLLVFRLQQAQASRWVFRHA